MKLKREDIDLSAPVGSYESLMAAVQGGANSVYFGVEKLNMRSRSSYNFNREDLKKIIGICNKHRIKTYLAVNIVLYDNELPQIKELIDFAKKEGVNAIIASDQAVINYACSVGMGLHI